jgi:hypothetical protein
MDRLVQQLNLTAKTIAPENYSIEPLSRVSHKILNVLEIRLNEEEIICLFLWLFNYAFSAFNNVQILRLRIVADYTDEFGTTLKEAVPVYYKSLSENVS